MEMEGGVKRSTLTSKEWAWLDPSDLEKLSEGEPLPKEDQGTLMVEDCLLPLEYLSVSEQNLGVSWRVKRFRERPLLFEAP